MKKWELKSLIDELEGKIISLQMDNGQLRTRVRNLKEGVNRQKERVNRHNERSEQLEKELDRLKLVEKDVLLIKDGMYEKYYVKDLREQNMKLRDTIITMQSELDGLRLVELDLSMTEEEYKVYEEGMKILNSEGEITQHDIEAINNGREFTEDEIAFLHSLPAIPITRQEVQEIALNVMERGILER